jgi:hypothetical protein
MEDDYPAEVRDRRQRGLLIGEVSCLAFEPMVSNNFLAVFMQLTGLMVQHARSRGIEQLLIAVHPQHARFYERFMGYQRVGPARAYPSVQNAPAVALCLDFAAIDQNRPRCWTMCFGSPLPHEALVAQPMSDEECNYFGPIARLIECPNPEALAA